MYNLACSPYLKRKEAYEITLLSISAIPSPLSLPGNSSVNTTEEGLHVEFTVRFVSCHIISMQEYRHVGKSVVLVCVRAYACVRARALTRFWY
jgi:hypothetical protein